MSLSPFQASPTDLFILNPYFYDQLKSFSSDITFNDPEALFTCEEFLSRSHPLPWNNPENDISLKRGRIDDRDIRMTLSRAMPILRLLELHSDLGHHFYKQNTEYQRMQLSSWCMTAHSTAQALLSAWELCLSDHVTFVKIICCFRSRFFLDRWPSNSQVT